MLLIIGVLYMLSLGSINNLVEADDGEICEGGLMKCAVSLKCIPLSWKCDGDHDCGENDTSDEEHCPPKTCAEHEMLCGDESCIPDRWRCDGEDDCADGEDENPNHCAFDNCNKDEFSCGDGTCINENWKCDGTDDCADGADEKGCAKTCDEDMFTCNSGQCISHTWICDGDTDCLDKSDELDCEEKPCRTDEFKCVTSRKCIDMKWRCDGDFDCQDHSDENVNCTYGIGEETDICNAETDFKCSSGECIHKSWKCDGDPDCTDGSDEGDFCEYKCKEDKFQCHNNYCVPLTLRCDQSADCLDGSDEWNCTHEVKCKDKGEFDCYGDNSYCIPNIKVCDGHNDCQHREDEEASLCKHKDPCENKVCPDHSTCQNQHITFNQMNAQCVCNSGFEWHEQEQVCKDIDECKERGVCSQICINTKGGYKCECGPNYVLEKHYYCRAKGEVPWLYFANRRDIRKLRIDSGSQDVVVNSTTNSVALDIDHEQKLMFYTDGTAEVIKSLTIAHSEDGMVSHGQPTVVISNMEQSSFAADGIAVDWLFKHIYWTNTGSDKIKLATYDGRYVKTLINSGLEEPRAIALDPENGYMYWTDWGKEAKIERCGMDGNNRETVVSKGDGLEWPNGLTIDYVDKRIYWIDAKLHKIGSAKMDGSDYFHVLVDAREIQQPFSISVFEDNVYWTDWHTNSIRSVNKITGHSATTLSLGSYSVMGIKVYHSLRQNRDFLNASKELCVNAQCGELCLPAARLLPKDTQRVVCACSDGLALGSDGKSCIKVVGTTTKITTAAQETTKKIVTTGTPVVTSGGYTIVSSTPAPTNETVTSQPAEPTGKIALIVGVCVGIVFCLVAVVFFVVYRKYRNRNKKSMHFDNPVYRKTTTDDQCMIPDENVPPQMQRLTDHERV